MSRRAQVFRDHAGGEARPSKHQADLAAPRGEEADCQRTHECSSLHHSIT
jgi:hypothetical protein